MSDAKDDPHDLTRFLRAQEGSYHSALGELQRGRKTSHWIWYIFPQVQGLGSSPTARHYAIKSREEAEAYLNHPVLGARLVECSRAMLAVEGKSASEILGYPDDMKLRSSMTLFARVSPDRPSIFDQVLEKYYQGKADQQTLQFLEKTG